MGDPSVPSGILERGLLLRLRFELDHHVNLRPARLYTGVRGPLAGKPEIDMLVVREGTEGPYAGVGGHLRKDTPHEIATEVSVNTAYGVERVVRDAFARAERRERKHLTLVHKTNVLTYAGSLWSRLVEEVSLEHPDVAVSYQHIDATMIHLVTDPGRFDVLVTDNLFGDIVTDLAAAVTGGIGLAASGNLDVSRRNPSMFEPVHGSAPDIAGAGHRGPDGGGAVGGAAARPPRRRRRGAPHRGRGRVRPRDPRPPGDGPHPVDRGPPRGAGEPPGRARRAVGGVRRRGVRRATVEELRARGGLKWTRYGPGSLGAFVAEMDTGTAPAVQAALRVAVEVRRVRLPAACAGSRDGRGLRGVAARPHGWAVIPTGVRPVAGRASRGLEIVIAPPLRAGAPVILPTPAYMPFRERAGRCWAGRSSHVPADHVSTADPRSTSTASTPPSARAATCSC